MQNLIEHRGWFHLPQQLVFQAVHRDGEVDDVDLDAHLREVVRVRHLGGEVHLEGVRVVHVRVADPYEGAVSLPTHVTAGQKEREGESCQWREGGREGGREEGREGGSGGGRRITCDAAGGNGSVGGGAGARENLAGAA